MRSRSRRVVVVVVAAVSVFALSGCAFVGGMVADAGDQVMVPPGEFSSKTERQTLEEALAHTDDLVQFLGGEWLDNHERVFVVTNNVRWSYGPCGAVDTNRYSINIQQIAPVADPLAKIELVRERWESRGYAVRQIGPAEADEGQLTGIYVDLPYGALLGFNASTEMMSISTQSECVKQG